MHGRAVRAIGLWVGLVILAAGGCWAWAASSSVTERDRLASETSTYAGMVADAATIAGPPEPAPAEPVEQAAAPVSTAEVAKGNSRFVSVDWARRMSGRVGIPQRALLGYAGAALALGRSTPSCHIDWTTLASLGDIESGHGTHAGSALGADGVATPAILGPTLGDGSSARGPMQFIDSTWARWGSDGNGDGAKDPQQIDDAALSTARYLCSYGDLSTATRWRAAIFGYNHLDSYVEHVVRMATTYAKLARAVRG